jgi:hypothetical protein
MRNSQTEGSELDRLRRTVPGHPNEEWLVVFFEKFDAAFQELLSAAERMNLELELVSHRAECGQRSVDSRQDNSTSIRTEDVRIEAANTPPYISEPQQNSTAFRSGKTQR